VRMAARRRHPGAQLTPRWAYAICPEPQTRRRRSAGRRPVSRSCTRGTCVSSGRPAVPCGSGR